MENEIYFAPPGKFNDPFDCRISINYQNRSEEFWTQFKMHLESYKIFTDYQIEIGYNHIKENPEIAQKEIDEQLFMEYDKKIGVLCLSSTWKSIKMWSHYGNNHKGFCLGYNRKHLEDLVPCSINDYVHYVDNYPQISYSSLKKGRDIELARMTAFTKSKEWREEKEYRIAATFGLKECSEKRFFKVNNETITEVTLGVNISKEDEENIKSICIKKEITLFKSFKHPSKFEILRKKIL
jgi:hypothetical protein